MLIFLYYVAKLQLAKLILKIIIPLNRLILIIIIPLNRLIKEGGWQWMDAVCPDWDD